MIIFHGSTVGTNAPASDFQIKACFYLSCGSLCLTGKGKFLIIRRIITNVNICIGMNIVRADHFLAVIQNIHTSQHQDISFFADISYFHDRGPASGDHFYDFSFHI